MLLFFEVQYEIFLEKDDKISISRLFCLFNTENKWSVKVRDNSSDLFYNQIVSRKCQENLAQNILKENSLCCIKIEYSIGAERW